MKKSLMILTILSLLLFGGVQLSFATYHTFATAAFVKVYDQPVVDNKVMVAEVSYNTSGWIVIHADNGGSPGAILGWSPVSNGLNKNVVVQLKGTGQTPVLYAMLHTDAGTIGKFEFPGVDKPVLDNGKIITPSFKVTATLVASVTVENQTLSGDTVTVKQVVSPGPGWMVIHAADSAGRVGKVTGYTAVSFGVNNNVVVTVNKTTVTTKLFAMLHADNGTTGTYEFPGADVPVKDANGNIVTPAFYVTIPSTSKPTGVPGFELLIAFAAITSVILVKRSKFKLN